MAEENKYLFIIIAIVAIVAIVGIILVVSSHGISSNNRDYVGNALNTGNKMVSNGGNSISQVLCVCNNGETPPPGCPNQGTTAGCNMCCIEVYEIGGTVIQV